MPVLTYAKAFVSYSNDTFFDSDKITVLSQPWLSSHTYLAVTSSTRIGEAWQRAQVSHLANPTAKETKSTSTLTAINPTAPTRRRSSTPRLLQEPSEATVPPTSRLRTSSTRLHGAAKALHAVVFQRNYYGKNI